MSPRCPHCGRRLNGYGRTFINHLDGTCGRWFGRRWLDRLWEAVWES